MRGRSGTFCDGAGNHAVIVVLWRGADMEAILRVYGRKLDISELLAGISMRPYRVDRAGVGGARTNCLHYEIAPFEDVESGWNWAIGIRALLKIAIEIGGAIS